MKNRILVAAIALLVCTLQVSITRFVAYGFADAPRPLHAAAPPSGAVMPG
jgi:hypothetical protein